MFWFNRKAASFKGEVNLWMSSSRLAALRSAAFTRTDLLVTMAVASVLAALVVAPLSMTRKKSQLKMCTNNLQQVARAVLLFAGDHDATLPGLMRTESGESWWWYKEEVKGYAGLSGASSGNDRLFACPLDRGYSDATPFCKNPRFDYSSYVFNGVTLLGTPNIAGWKLAALNQPRRTLLVAEWPAHAPLSWHRSKTGKANAPFYSDAESIIAFADGHASLTKIYYDGYNAAYTRDPTAVTNTNTVATSRLLKTV
jgi:type II secretory pathway pseudopilin PulG